MAVGANGMDPIPSPPAIRYSREGNDARKDAKETASFTSADQQRWVMLVNRLDGSTAGGTGVTP